MPLLVAMTLLGFSGYAALLPVAPLWAVHGGAGSMGAGLVNGVLMLFTVLTQLVVPASLRRFGWAPVLAAGMLLLGLPAAAFALSEIGRASCRERVWITGVAGAMGKREEVVMCRCC